MLVLEGIGTGVGVRVGLAVGVGVGYLRPMDTLLRNRRLLRVVPHWG